MRVCLMIEGQEGVTWDDWLELARAAEHAELDALFRSDHYFPFADRSGGGSLDAWTTLAALAASTTTLRLGSLVSPATFRHPSVLARSVATVDHVSGGRVELGLGAGWHQGEHTAYGFPFADLSERLSVFAEQLEIVHREWTEESFDFDGRHYVLSGCRAEPKPLQQPHPPLIVGGSAGRGTVEPAVRFADEYNTIFCGPDECRRRRERLDAACERGGRDPATLPLSLMTTGVIGRDDADVRRRTDRVAERMGRRPDPGATVVGTLDEVVERLGEYQSAGVTRVMLQNLDYTDVEHVGLLGEVARALA
jgi:F420-dependent oxidoreductase-like protein